MDRYHDVNSYVVSELPTPMWDDVNVQPCLTCGTFADRIVEIDLWMSGGGSKSLLHKVITLQCTCRCRNWEGIGVRRMQAPKR